MAEPVVVCEIRSAICGAETIHQEVASSWSGFHWLYGLAKRLEHVVLQRLPDNVRRESYVVLAQPASEPEGRA